MSDALAPVRSRPALGWVVGAAVVLLIAVLPMVLRDSYWRGVLVIGALNVILALGLDFIIGYAGQLNLGISAFYGIGAYASTLLVTKAGLPFWPALVAGALIAGIAGLVLALFAVRLRGHYLAVASLGFAVITYEVLINWISLTDGPLGIYGILPPPDIAMPGGFVVSFTNQANLFYLIAGVAGLVFLVLRALVRSPIGEALTAVREDEIAANSLGIDSARWKMVAFGIGSAVAGLAGGLYPPFIGTLVPDAFTVVVGFNILAMVIVGGVGTLTGPVLGAILLSVLPELLRPLGDARMVLYGAALTAVVMFAPSGIAGLWRRR